MNLKTTKFFTLLLILCLFGANLQAETYYSAGSYDATLVASWKTGTDGSGSSPANFTTAGDIFIIQNGHSMTTSAAWTIGAASGNTGKLQIATSGKLTATFDVTIIAGVTFQIDAGGTYEHNVANNMSLLFGGTESFDTNSNFIVTLCANPLIGIPDNGYGNLTFKNTLTAQLSLNSKVTNVKGNLTIEASSSNTTLRTIVFVQDGATTTINIDGNLIINSTATNKAKVNMVNTAAANATINLKGNLNVLSGEFGMNSGGASAANTVILNIEGNLSISTGASMASATSSTGATTKLIFKGANSVFSNSGTFSNGNITSTEVINGAKLTLNSAFAVPTNKSLIVDGSVTANATFTNNGTVQLKSSIGGTGTLITTGTVDGTGTYSINQYLTAGRNWYISNPMNTAVSPTVASGTVTINGYDETTVGNGAGTWAVTTNPLAVGKGYVASVSTDGNITFTGTPNTGNTNIPLTSRTGTADKAGFNLIGNPYPSYLDWSLVAPASSSNLAKLRSNVFWYRTVYTVGKSAWAANSNYALDAIVYNGTSVYKATQGGISAPSGGPTGNSISISDGTVIWAYQSSAYYFWTINGDGVGVPSGANSVIPPMQSFWVRAAENVSQPIVVTNAMRSHAPASDKLLKAPAATNTDRTLVRLQVSNGVNTDETVLYVSENALNDSDNYDAPKMSNGSTNIPEIFTTLNSERLVINALNNIPTDTPIGLGFIPGNATSFSIKANEIANLPSDVKVILKDNVTLAETDLTDGVTSYEFSPETTSSDRFSVIFRSAGSTTNLYNSDKHSIQIYVNEVGQIVIVSNEEVKYSIFNAVGQLFETGLTTTKQQVNNRKLKPGMYVVLAGNQSTRVIIK